MSPGANNEILKSIIVLASGPASAGLISVLILPILTRIYSPADFELVAVLTAIITLVSVVGSLRLNTAIPLVITLDKTLRLVRLSLFLILLISCVSALTLYFFRHEISAQFPQLDLNSYLWIVPIGIILASSYDVLQFWHTKSKNFSLIASTRFYQAIFGAFTQIGLGLYGVVPGGMIFGTILKSGIGLGRLFSNVGKFKVLLVKRYKLSELYNTFIEFRRFSMVSVPEAILNIGSSQLPVIIVAMYAAGAEAGFLFLAMRILVIPTRMLGSSVGQVFISEAPKKFAEGSLRQFTLRIVLLSLKISTIPLLACFFAGMFLFSPLFGEEWARAGEILALLVPAAYLQFVSSSISYSFHVLDKIKIALYLQFVGFFLRVVPLPFLALYEAPYLVETFAACSLMFQALFLATIFKTMRKV